MKCLIFAFVILGFQLTAANAESLFGYRKIDFFHGAEVQQPDKPPLNVTENSPERVESEWAEPVVSPSGKVSIYLPPKEVRDFLEKPDPENARTYLNWNLKRINKLILAQQLLAKEAKGFNHMPEKTNIEPSETGFAPAGSAPVMGAGYLFYFMRKGCPVCEEQSEVIRKIYIRHPEIRIVALARGFSDRELKKFVFPARQDEGMRKVFKIKVYPSLAIINSHNKRYLISGYADEGKIMELLK